MGNLVQPCMNGKKMQDSGVRLSGSRLKIHVRVEDSLSIQAREESNASRNFRQSQRKISDKVWRKVGKMSIFVSSEKHTVGINMLKRHIWTAKKVTGQKLPEYTLPWAHKKRQSVQTCSKVCLFFSHSEVQVPQVTRCPKFGHPQWQVGQTPSARV